MLESHPGQVTLVVDTREKLKTTVVEIIEKGDNLKF